MFKKLWTILMGFFRSGSEAIIDRNALVLIDQQIHNANSAISDSEKELVSLKTTLKLEERRDSELNVKLNEYTESMPKLLEKGTSEAEATALKVAQKIAELETQQAVGQKTIARLTITVSKINSDIQKAKAKIKEYELRKNTVAANESMLKTTAQISSVNAGRDSEMNLASESLARKEAQQERDMARFEAADEYDSENSGDSLERELQALKVKPGESSAESVMARFKKVETISQ